MRIGPAIILFSLIFFVAEAAPPSTPIDTYFAARARYAAELCKETDAAQAKAYPGILTDLERLLTGFVAPWHANGFPAKGQFTVVSLCREDIETGMLDGFAYKSGDTTVTVTSMALVKHWLVDHQNWWGQNDVPASVAAAFRSDAFYTQAISTDTAAQLHGMVPVKAPLGADIAVAEIAIFAQYFVTNRGPDTLLAVVARGDRVFIARQKLAVALATEPDCRTELDLAVKDALGTSAPKDAKRNLALREQADRDYRACFAQHVREQPNYAAVQKQAQALVDLLR